MITRFYVDNYKCLQNFEYKPKQFELVVGANGSGKSTVFEALDKVRRFVNGDASAIDLFTPDTRTRWDVRSKQIFEIDFIIGTDIETILEYKLEINLSSTKHRIEKEILKRNGETLIETEWVDLNEDEYGSLEDEDDPFGDHFNQVRMAKMRGGAYKFALTDRQQSAVSNGHTKILVHFYFRIQIIKINAALMSGQVKRPEPRPSNDMSNFASYYLYSLQKKQGRMFEMLPHLKEVITDFDSFEVDEDFEEGRRDLRVIHRHAMKHGPLNRPSYRFDELSDGQRALIALYTLLFCTLDENTTLVIDEPENYVALRELQPWLSLLQERLEEHGGQVILISHHPEFINALAPQTTVFERDNGGPVRVKAFDSELAKTLAPAEIMARGWES